MLLAKSLYVFPVCVYAIGGIMLCYNGGKVACWLGMVHKNA